MSSWTAGLFARTARYAGRIGCLASSSTRCARGTPCRAPGRRTRRGLTPTAASAKHQGPGARAPAERECDGDAGPSRHRHRRRLRDRQGDGACCWPAKARGYSSAMSMSRAGERLRPRAPAERLADRLPAARSYRKPRWTICRRRASAGGARRRLGQRRRLGSDPALSRKPAGNVGPDHRDQSDGRGPANPRRAAADGRSEQRARSSTSRAMPGRVGSTGETVYAAAKGGLIAFTKSLAREIGALPHQRQLRVSGPDRYAVVPAPAGAHEGGADPRDPVSPDRPANRDRPGGHCSS